MSQYLKDRPQDESETPNKDIESVAGALVYSTIIQNKDKDVKLQAACCLADIIRLFAPQAPYNEKQLEVRIFTLYWGTKRGQRVFALFIEQLKGLEEVNSPSFARCFYLLERLSVVKAFVLLVDLSDELLVTLFKTLFQIASYVPYPVYPILTFLSPEHSHKVITHMLDVMSSCIDECPQISQPLLDCILHPLLPSAKAESPKAHQLASALVQRTSNRLQGPISQFLSDSLVSTKATTSDLKDESHTLLYELFVLSPGLLKDVLPNLELELKVPTHLSPAEVLVVYNKGIRLKQMTCVRLL